MISSISSCDCNFYRIDIKKMDGGMSLAAAERDASDFPGRLVVASASPGDVTADPESVGTSRGPIMMEGSTFSRSESGMAAMKGAHTPALGRTSIAIGFKCPFRSWTQR